MHIIFKAKGSFVKNKKIIFIFFVFHLLAIQNVSARDFSCEIFSRVFTEGPIYKGWAKFSDGTLSTEFWRWSGGFPVTKVETKLTQKRVITRADLNFTKFIMSLEASPFRSEDDVGLIHGLSSYEINRVAKIIKSSSIDTLEAQGSTHLIELVDLQGEPITQFVRFQNDTIDFYARCEGEDYDSKSGHIGPSGVKGPNHFL